MMSCHFPRLVKLEPAAIACWRIHDIIGKWSTSKMVKRYLIGDQGPLELRAIIMPKKTDTGQIKKDAARTNTTMRRKKLIIMLAVG